MSPPITYQIRGSVTLKLSKMVVVGKVLVRMFFGPGGTKEKMAAYSFSVLNFESITGWG